MYYWLMLMGICISVLYAYFKVQFTYWEKRGVKQFMPGRLWGNIDKITSIHNTQLWQEIYDECQGKAALVGTYIFTRPIAVILDLDLVKAVLIRDFHVFADRTNNHNPKEILSQHLFSADSKLWKTLRTKLTPTFTSGKMRFMFPTLVAVSQEFTTALEKELERQPDRFVNIYDWNARFTTDVIGSCVFGVECNSLKDPNVEFRKIGQKAFGVDSSSVKWRLLKMFYIKYFKFLGLRRSPKILEEFFVRIVHDTVLERERRNIHRNDFIDILIELKNRRDEKGNPMLSIDLMAAQLFVFFAAGFETSSSNMSYGLFQLAKNPEKQEKLRQEIEEVLKKYNNVLSYEAMKEMTYLDQVITETLRLYPALATLQRVCLEDYRIPDSDIILEKGTSVAIPVRAIHHDPKIYENPEQFEPERFHPSQEQLRHPQSFLGFGDGPRNCIGLRFGRMQVKVGLIALLTKFKFSLSPKTPKEVEISNYSFVTVPGNGVWLRIDKL
ncbi:cytochrome P450 6a2-like [Haematobia irritans]|uniref:cytochrome P450 6a2-like n=1 Tax=Haematobia irritans TaxID=7368 RepID=UPI003F4F89E8